MNTGKKAAVLFPGIGYTNDRPLLYYAKKLAQKHGYEIIPVNYTGFQNPKDVIGKADAMKASFELAYEQSEKILADVKWESYQDIVFVSKSVGTAAAACYSMKHDIPAGHIYYTPVAGTFLFMKPESGIAFHGTADPWAEDETVEDSCRKLHVPLYEIDHGNHSLETGDVQHDLDIMKKIMKKTEAYLRSRS